MFLKIFFYFNVLYSYKIYSKCCENICCCCKDKNKIKLTKEEERKKKENERLHKEYLHNKEIKNISDKIEEKLKQNNSKLYILDEKKETLKNFAEILKIYCNNNTIDINNLKIDNIEDTESISYCLKFTIDINGKKKEFFIKKNNNFNNFYIDIFKKLDLCDLNYIEGNKCILTESIDLTENKNYNDFNVYDKKTKKADTTILDKADNITNFKEFIFFCALLDLTDCNPLFRLDNCYIKDNKIKLLDFYHYNIKEYNENYERIYDFTENKNTVEEKKESFYNVLYIHSILKFQDLYDYYLNHNDDKIDEKIFSLLFLLKNECGGHFFADSGVYKGLEENINKINDKYNNPIKHCIGDEDETNIIFNKFNITNRTNKKIVDLKIAFKKIYLDKFGNDINKFNDFINYICDQLWSLDDICWKYLKDDFKEKCYKNDVNNFKKIVKDNIENALKILQDQKKKYYYYKYLNEKKFKEIINKPFTENEINNINQKLQILKDFLDNNKDKIQIKFILKKIQLVKDSKIFPELNFNIFDDLLKK